MYITIVIVFLIGYVFLIALYYRSWNALEGFSLTNGDDQHIFLSIIIPARNEADSIEMCIRSILDQDYYDANRREIIVVDDHSTDATALVVEALNLTSVRVIKLAEMPIKEGEVAYKKRAIEIGVAHSHGDVIVTTDADCHHHPKWLRSINAAFVQGDIDMVSGPVLFDYDQSIFQRFQALDFIGMIGITAASLHLGMFNLANGANLAFRKSVFSNVEGYAGIDRKASGDDMLLIYKFAQQDASRVRFLKSKEACVYTRPAMNLGEFIQQRLRWTSKSFSYQDKRITWILAFVYLVNLIFVINGIAALFSQSPTYHLLFVLQILVLFSVDFLFLKKVSGFFDRKDLLKSFLPSQIVHVAYIVVIGLLGNIVQYKWKGRKLK